MKYRINKRTGDRISEIGLGSAYMFSAGMDEAVRALHHAVEGGINYFDLAAGDGTTFPIYGEALHEVRKQILFQIHFGADYTKGTYGWSLELDTIKRSVERQLKELRTDYIDYGFIHCQDEFSDWETYLKNGVYDYILALQKQGVVRHLGLSSHTPTVIQRILDEAPVDMLMFSLNPAYDYGQGEYAYGGVDERSAIYRRCEAEGIGISVMKPFSGGQLLDAKQSPFGKALTQFQCIRYCLDKPGVLTVLPGAQSVQEVETLLSYFDQAEEETDYSEIASFAPPQASGKCVYCNHCKPCPMGIDVGLVNKFYDLARAGDALAVEHYRTLERNAEDCIGCGHCDSRCPFSVPQSQRMQEIRAFFSAGMRHDKLTMLQDTLGILEQGFYIHNGRRIPLSLTRKQMEAAEVYLPDDVQRISKSKDFEHIHVMGRCGYSCQNMDSFSLARKSRRLFSFDLTQPNAKPILVLNFANPVNPGGGVRRGATAQEEDLCRKSSLLLSLEGKNAAAYYTYNRSLNSYMGSDAIIIHPQVEIIRGENGELLEEPVVVAVMTCAAPMLTYGLEGMTQAQYEAMLLQRITGMLKVAAYLGYQRLVLGAFGCGAFRNDPHVVSDLFYKALKEFDFDGMKESDMFRRIDFAVMDHSEEQYYFKEFLRNFSHFYRDEDQAEIDRALAKKKATEVHLDAIRGCIFGGAAGDALGYPVEFLREKDIFARYGENGITTYEKDRLVGKAVISDDTQMTLFTACGLLLGDTRGCMRGIQGNPRTYVAKAYLDWLMTQESSIQEVNRHKRYTDEGGFSWLLDVPELYARRAPGNTCISALEDQKNGETFYDYVKAKRNNSKGCGGIMRVAPIAVNYQFNIEKLDMEGAQLAAITHGHSLGYMPAAVLVHILNRIVFPPKGQKKPLKEIVLEARDTAKKLFAGDENLPELVHIIDFAISLSENENHDDLSNIHQLGEGWVAEETLGISLYCALRHQDDFSAGVIAAVNHNGDSDSTGAVTGNILGALCGYRAIEEKWKQDLELSDVILEIADDLCHGCQMSEYSSYRDEAWEQKYIYMRRAKKPPVFFWMDDGENGCFSNWYRCKFVIDDFEYLHVEQYMMAQKAKLFHDSVRYTAILRATSPKECKELGRQVTPFDSNAWGAVKFQIVKAGNRAKYEQNPDLKQKLLDTGNAILAEASPCDKIWGIGLDAAEAAKLGPAFWPGKNLLGKVLMELREEFAAKK